MCQNTFGLYLNIFMNFLLKNLCKKISLFFYKYFYVNNFFIIILIGTSTLLKEMTFFSHIPKKEEKHL